MPVADRRPLSDAEQQAVIEHDVAKLRQPKSLLDMALEHIGQTRLELEVQLDDAAESCRQLRQEIAWLDQQRDQLLARGGGGAEMTTALALPDPERTALPAIRHEVSGNLRSPR